METLTETPQAALEAFGLLDQAEASIATLPPAKTHSVHRFAPGLYCRETFLPAGTLLTSKIHKTTHVFTISMGDILVWTPESGAVRYVAPFTDITKPGTRRVLFALKDTVWSTYHVTEKTDLAEIEADIIEPHINPLLENHL